MNFSRQTFDKSERLCSYKVISCLFEEGKIFHTSLFKVVWMESPVKLPHPAQVAFSVSKRNFKLAVTRNLIKRRMRETYRLNKNVLYDYLNSAGKQLVIVIIIKGNNVPGYPEVNKAMSEILQRLIRLPQSTEK